MLKKEAVSKLLKSSIPSCLFGQRGHTPKSPLTLWSVLKANGDLPRKGRFFLMVAWGWKAPLRWVWVQNRLLIQPLPLPAGQVKWCFLRCLFFFLKVIPGFLQQKNIFFHNLLIFQNIENESNSP
jgi:hypothetical protein